MCFVFLFELLHVALKRTPHDLEVYYAVQPEFRNLVGASYIDGLSGNQETATYMKSK